jgi:hypothetical protein
MARSGRGAPCGGSSSLVRRAGATEASPTQCRQHWWDGRRLHLHLAGCMGLHPCCLTAAGACRYNCGYDGLSGDLCKEATEMWVRWAAPQPTSSACQRRRPPAAPASSAHQRTAPDCCSHRYCANQCTGRGLCYYGFCKCDKASGDALHVLGCSCRLPLEPTPNTCCRRRAGTARTAAGPPRRRPARPARSRQRWVSIPAAKATALRPCLRPSPRPCPAVQPQRRSRTCGRCWCCRPRCTPPPRRASGR